MATNPFNALTTQFTSSVDPVNDSIPFWQKSSNEAFWINNQTFNNIVGSVVGTSDTQTLTNKTLTSPTISGPTLSGTITGTYTIGGTPTFPSSVATLTGSQTLTNKTLTSPTINGPTISNATITADTVAGYTSGTSGTIYGMSVASGVLASAALAGAVNAAALATNAVLSGKLGLSSSFTGGVATQSNSGSAGGTIYYINLGGIKLAWGTTTAQTIGGAAPASASVGITFPVSFFSTVQIAVATPGPSTGTQYNGFSTNTLTASAWSLNFYIVSGSAGVFNANWLVIGT